MKTTRIFFPLVFILLIATACRGESPGADETATPTILPQESLETTFTPVDPAQFKAGSGSFFSINEIGLGSNGFVALTNFTGVPASLGGLYLCQGSECFELPDVSVEPDETVRIAVGDGSGHEGVVATGATFGELKPANGEIALYASQELEDPEEMLVYFQWGSSPHELTRVAIEAGLWVEGGFGPSSENATRLYKVPESGLWLFEE